MKKLTLSLLRVFFLAGFLSGCAKFSHSNLLSDSFGCDLRPFITKKQTSYSDGCLLIFDISEDDSLYKRFFSDYYLNEDVGLGFTQISFNTLKEGEIRYRKLGAFDGFTKVVFYIPRNKILGFGFATAIGG